MQTIDRFELMAWISGTVLSFEKGVGFAVDENHCKEVEDALNRGETVLLTVGGKVVSQMKLFDGAYQEEVLNLLSHQSIKDDVFYVEKQV